MTAAAWLDLAFVMVVLIDFYLLASSRLPTAIRAVALQGAVLSAPPLLLTGAGHSLEHMLLLSAGALVIKAAVIPWLMFRAIRETAVRREVEPFVTPVTSMVLGAAGVAAAFALSRSLPLPSVEQHPFLVPTALGTVWVGLLLMVSRKKAVSQVLGFLVLENGVFLFGLLLSDVMPVMVEAGVLLDLLAAVFVMGIVMFDIQRELSSLDTEKLQRLRD
ncbi:MAG TPA: NADH-quinone oxidoreductase subunit K [Anaeromyxobacteraceae bacterium]|nr:NADH-quinone oxidoreductase subunit K [Anaeromyxobacteraceae bacterium]